ncbi:MAG: hypothetical protein H6Q33_5413, partial [Deltaproteobacteria bacterium]|nr:hypothetical protein [Deltaproteobacteria bacterium]MBS1147253.1 hypothetical protein [Pseudomonadota bacterium]
MDQLSPAYCSWHRKAIESRVMRRRPLGGAETAKRVGAGQGEAAVTALGAADLVVLLKDRREIVAADPVTSEQRMVHA